MLILRVKPTTAGKSCVRGLWVHPGFALKACFLGIPRVLATAARWRPLHVRRTRTDRPRAAARFFLRGYKAFANGKDTSWFERNREPSDHRLDGIFSMVALLAHSFGVGFSNVEEASGALLAGRRRPPGQHLYVRRWR